MLLSHGKGSIGGVLGGYKGWRLYFNRKNKGFCSLIMVTYGLPTTL
jgi:hypothetical protein